MAKRSDIQFSLEGETQPTQAVQEHQYELPVNPATASKTIIFKLVNTKRNGGTWLPAIEDVVNPATKAVERMRLLSGVTSIWLKDQKDITPEYAKINLRTIEFPRGQKWIKVPEYDTALLEFLKYSKHNVKGPNAISGSPFGFFEYDPAEQAKAAYDRELLELEMAFKVKEMPIEQVKKMASFLNISQIDEMGWPKEPESIRAELMVRAKRDPKSFEKIIDSKEIEIAFLVKKAILDSKIDLGRTTGSAHFATGGFICKIPPGRNPQEFLIELASAPTYEGKQFLEQLKQIVT